ncbi:MAG: 50S ribosomal protein L9 [Proteobacteria bacterium]|nr:50S ribosomal protein L9 [Pseudomonadota bacterium]MDA1023116.1 50S ribosomal protein L9 [Pseudomonadota bacterium]
MDVILLERIDKLGQMGDVVKVKSGYARNFLLPQKKALRATEENKKHFDAQRAQLETANLENRAEAEKLGKKMSELAVILVRQAGEAGQLYGSVNARDIAASVTEAGFTITRQQVELANPIKALGLHQVKVMLHPEVSVAVTTNVARSVEEAKIQTKTGHAVTNEEDNTATAPVAASPDVAVEAADKAVAEQADEIFEEGARPEAVPEEEPEKEEVAEEKLEADSGEAKAE